MQSNFEFLNKDILTQQYYEKANEAELSYVSQLYSATLVAVRTVAENIAREVADLNYLIIDEAQYIKNIQAQKTKKIKEINACHRLALTGTPIENNMLDLWSIFDFIMPKYLEGITSFKSSLSNEQYISLIAKCN